MYTPSPEQHALSKRVDNETKWAVARAYRAKRQEGCGNLPARYAAIDVLEPHFPAMSRFELSKIAATIIAHAARHHGAWLWEDTSHGWSPPWMPNAMLQQFRNVSDRAK